MWCFLQRKPQKYAYTCMHTYIYTHIYIHIYTHTHIYTCIYAQSLSCVQLCDPLHCRLPVFFVHGIFQARILEWGCHFLLRGSSWSKVKPASPALHVDSLLLSHQRSTCVYIVHTYIVYMCVYVCSFVSHSLWPPWTIACQAPLSIEFSSQEYCSELPCPPPGDLPNPGIEPTNPESFALAGGFFTAVPPEKPIYIHVCIYIYNIGIYIHYTHMSVCVCTHTHTHIYKTSLQVSVLQILSSLSPCLPFLHLTCYSEFLSI